MFTIGTHAIVALNSASYAVSSSHLIDLNVIDCSLQSPMAPPMAVASARLSRWACMLLLPLGLLRSPSTQPLAHSDAIIDLKLPVLPTQFVKRSIGPGTRETGTITCCTGTRNVLRENRKVAPTLTFQTSQPKPASPSSSGPRTTRDWRAPPAPHPPSWPSPRLSRRQQRPPWLQILHQSPRPRRLPQP